MPFHCAKCREAVENYRSSDGPKKHWETMGEKKWKRTDVKCTGSVVLTVESKVTIPERTGNALQKRTGKVTLSTTDVHSTTNAMGYHTASADAEWSEGYAGAAHTSFDTKGLKKTAKKELLSGNGHAEQNAYKLMSDCGDAGWFAFVQNAPPCTAECLPFFIKKSSDIKGGGFIFKITADHGWYCKEYEKLNSGVIPQPPFNIFVWEGKWGFEAPEGAPSVETLV